MRKTILLLIVTLALQGCSLFEKEPGFTYLDQSKAKDRVTYLDPEATSLFRSVYFLDYLGSQQLYAVRDELNLDMHFDPSVTRINIQNARNYFSQITLVKDLEYTKVPYWNNEVLTKKFSKVHLRIFIEDQLYLYEGTDLVTYARIYYENHAMDLAFKHYKNKDFETYKSAMLTAVPNITDMLAVKPIKDSIMIIHVESIEALSDTQVKIMKDALEKDLGPLYDKEDNWPFSPNAKHLGLILQFYEQGDLNSEYVYFNGLEKRWMDTDWRNFDFFRANALLTDR